MKVFVPISDEMLERMDGSEIPIPYQPGMKVQAKAKHKAPTRIEAMQPSNSLPAGRPAPVAVPMQVRR
jgi:hypothetical protein